MKKGFTLIELLAVIAILAIILVIVMPSVTNILNRTQNRLNSEQKSAIIDATRQWAVSNLIINENKIYYNGVEKNYITLGELQTSGYLENKEIQNMTDRKVISTDTKICIKYENYQFTYEYDGEC